MKKLLSIIIVMFVIVNPFAQIKGQNVYRYPSMIRHDNRFWNNTRFLYEKVQPKHGAGDFECVKDAVDTLPYSMPYYGYYVNKDTKILRNMDNVPKDIGIVIFSRALSEESELLPSGGDTSPVLHLSSLLKIMCPRIKTRTGYARTPYARVGYDRVGYDRVAYQNNTQKGYYDYLLFQYDVSDR